ncbi:MULTISPECIES: copper resistance CopC family protein [unclassified Pseudoalteromonas]|uniref:copper resistance CopC family protein n=1 Tax=unclassified Pseudoalteromonas TaxID=194690 RepID=UPI000CF69661|nr:MULTISPECIES: copper resistance protein CopC [unclassified Pseudoalteromonas]MBS3796152.1 copper resistance protein CopC [Pseudoalteromonas sp. BDTF-M6]
MKSLIHFLAAITLAFSSAVFAHVDLKTSVPADKATLAQTPELLSLTFTKEVRLVKVSLKNAQGEAIKFGFKPTKEASLEHSWALPELAPSSYQVDMIFLGQDGHKMKSSVSFVVN